MLELDRAGGERRVPNIHPHVWIPWRKSPEPEICRKIRRRFLQNLIGDFEVVRVGRRGVQRKKGLEQEGGQQWQESNFHKQRAECFRGEYWYLNVFVRFTQCAFAHKSSGITNSPALSVSVGGLPCLHWAAGEVAGFFEMGASHTLAKGARWIAVGRFILEEARSGRQEFLAL